MSPRRNRRAALGPPSRRGGAPSRGGGAPWVQETEEWPDGAWIVRPVPGTGAVKPYRCPGCDQTIPPGVGHVVAWRADDRDGQDRRHWHRPCWQARDRRTPRIMRSRSAPRY